MNAMFLNVPLLCWEKNNKKIKEKNPLLISHFPKQKQSTKKKKRKKKKKKKKKRKKKKKKITIVFSHKIIIYVLFTGQRRQSPSPWQ